MAFLTGSASFQSPLDQIVVRVETPRYRYDDKPEGSLDPQELDRVGSVDRVEIGTFTASEQLGQSGFNFGFEIPDSVVIGESWRAFRYWQSLTTWDERIAKFGWQASTIDGILLASGVFEAFLFFEDPLATAHDNYAGRVLFFVNADAYRRLLRDHPLGIDQQDDLYLSYIKQIGRFTRRGSRLEQADDDVIAEWAEMLSIGIEVAQEIAGERWTNLTSFAISIPDQSIVSGAGQVTIQGATNLAPQDLARYTVGGEVRVERVDGPSSVVALVPRWDDMADPVIFPVAFTLDTSTPVFDSSVRGDIEVRVTAFDGTVVWSRSYRHTEPGLQNIDIVVPSIVPEPLGAVGESAERALRGRVVSRQGDSVAELTILIQAKASADDAVWRIVATAITDPQGNFMGPLPSGRFEAAQALVSAAPDSVTDLKVETEIGGEPGIADDFIFLILDRSESGVDDTTESTRPVDRLPEQADLIRSGQYSQDLGGGCFNITTPNRTISEHRYNAVVRFSDPDIANYTLSKTDDGTFVLKSAGETLRRQPVSLLNPILWQHAPEAGDELSFYQSVSVATGHVLYFRSVLKADGYSLGDLVYSLPLAPGQKKQIVSYDVSNTLQASESQSIEQGEALSAELNDDRSITDQLAGSINENLDGRSRASTAGVSAGLGLGGSIGAISGSLGVAGGYSRSSSSASQQGSRNVTQFFGEKLRQSILQNTEAYRGLKASVVTTVRDGQEYAVTTEVVANHNHCHSLTMMYFEVLRHYAVSQELAEVQECLFIPLLLTEFDQEKTARWKDVLAASLLPVPSKTSGLTFWSRGRRRHPLLPAFDALERVRTEYSRVDFPEGSYAEEQIRSIEGYIDLRVDLPRPRTRLDRIFSLPITTETRKVSKRSAAATAAGFIFGGLLGGLFGGSRSVEIEEQVKQRVFDEFFTFDANYETVHPRDAIRVTDFTKKTITEDAGTVELDFFQNEADREHWEAYATVLGLNSPEDLLNQYFQGRLVSEFDRIYRDELAPVLYDRIAQSLVLSPIGPNERDGSLGGAPNLDFTRIGRYNGGSRRMRISLSGGAQTRRDSLAVEMNLRTNSRAVHGLRIFELTDIRVERVRMTYQTDHHRGVIANTTLNNDLLDASFDSGGARFDTRLNHHDKRNPRLEDDYLTLELLDHLNSNIEHYNKVLWTMLDPDRRFMLLDGFHIEVFDANGDPLPARRSLASVVKNELITIAGNSLVFPVADGFRVTSTRVIAADDSDSARTLMDHYRETDPVPAYRISVPTSGVYAEAVMGECDSCEPVKPNSSQDWTKFTTEQPTEIAPVIPPSPERFDWRAAWSQFASPLVQLQVAPETPAPGAGLAGLSDALNKADSFRDVTGLAANQQNAIRTYLSNQENAKAFAEMAKSMAMQQHNSENSDSIMRSLGSARDSEAIDEDTYRNLVRDHLGQQIDGGQRQGADIEQQESAQPSLTNAAIEAIREGGAVEATRRSSSGEVETVSTGGGNQSLIPVLYDVPLIAQPNKTSCWAASMAMIESYAQSIASQSSIVVSAQDLADEYGFSLEQSYDWNRLETVRNGLELQVVTLVGTQYPSSSQWRTWLVEHGPLYVTIQGAPSHAIIVRGISGDGNSESTLLDLLNPWDVDETFDRDPTVFNPPNEGVSMRWSVDRLNGELNGGRLAQLSVYQNWRILYKPGVVNGDATVAPTGSATDQRIRVINRFWEADQNVGAVTVSVTGAIEDEEQNFSGGRHHWAHLDLSQHSSEPTYGLVVTAQTALEDEPVNWTAFNPSTGTDRVWLVERATVRVENGQIVEIVDNPNITLDGTGRVTVALRPLWARSPNIVSPRTEVIDRIVIHHTGSNNDLPPVFMNAANIVSAHYVIARTGEIIKLVAEVDSANHAGTSIWRGDSSLSGGNNPNNHRSIGIEIVHRTGNYTEEQYTSIIQLLGQLRTANPTINLRDVIGHSDIGVCKPWSGAGAKPRGGCNSHTTTPRLGRKGLDPGRTFEWTRLESARVALAPADEAVTFTATSPVEQIYDSFFDGNTDARLSSGATGASVLQLKLDLSGIGYYVGDTSTDEFSIELAAAVMMFKIRYFTGTRLQNSAAFYSDRGVDFTTAQMIKRVSLSV